MVMIIAIQGPLLSCFSAPLGCPLSALVSMPFHIHAKNNFGKKKV